MWREKDNSLFRAVGNQNIVVVMSSRTWFKNWVFFKLFWSQIKYQCKTGPHQFPCDLIIWHHVEYFALFFVPAVMFGPGSTHHLCNDPKFVKKYPCKAFFKKYLLFVLICLFVLQLINKHVIFWKFWAKKLNSTI